MPLGDLPPNNWSNNKVRNIKKRAQKRHNSLLHIQRNKLTFIIHYISLNNELRP